jgi:cyanate permease
VNAVAPDDDPILIQRAKALRLANLGQRVGYLLYGIAIVVFLIGLLTDFNGTVSAIVTFGVIAGSIVLAPAILAGYAVKAAVRDDLEHGRDIG